MIPDEMKETDQWICWKEEDRGGKQTKIPTAPWEHGGNAAANDPDNWTDYETAKEWVDYTPGLRLGFVFQEDGPFVGIDLDDCVEWEDGDPRIKVSTRDIISRCGSYTEYSPSRTGLHILCKGELDAALKNDDRGVEIYDRDRFFTVTGDVPYRYQNDPRHTTISEAKGALDFLMDEYMVDHDEPPETEPKIDSGAVRRASGDHALYNLDVSDVYPTITAGENTDHPVHGSSTGANFKIEDGSGSVAICWRGEHEYSGNNTDSNGQGCVLCAWHLLAMEGANINNCRRVRRHYPDDDAMVFAAWKEAYRQGLVDGTTPPWRAVNHIATEYLDDMSGGGKGAWATFRTACRIIRAEHDIPVEIDSRDPCEYDGCDEPVRGVDADYCCLEHELSAAEEGAND